MKYLSIVIFLFALGCGDSKKGFEGKISSHEKFELNGDTIEFEIVYQDDGPPIDSTNTFINYDESPKIAIGVNTFYSRMRQALKKSNCPKGKLFIQGVVNTEGSFEQVSVIKPTIDDDCLEIIKKAMNKIEFIPGTSAGSPVRTRMIFPIEVP
ncbi:MAG: hypothetical protein AAGJ93_07890 [Bacteroidota bacterium]